MTENLKKGILLKIEDTLETLQLRLMLNRETIVNEEEDSSLQEALDLYRKVTQQNKQANLVIKECEETIEKLLLLKKYNPDLSIDSFVVLYNNYEGLSINQFQHKLMAKLGKRQSSQ